jgi:hypothetical protein
VESGIFLDYRGPVNFAVTESLLKKLKKNKEYLCLNKTTGKRVYSLAVECLENITRYSSSKPGDKKVMQPHILIRRESDKIVIISGNPVRQGEKAKLIRKLDKINNSDEAELKSSFERKIKSDIKNINKCAGLGLLFMALKTGNRIDYSFYPITEDQLYFEIKLCLNKYIMRKLTIDKTSSTPLVVLDPDKRSGLLSGESRPSDVREFYDQILSWMNEYSSYLIKSEGNKDPFTFSFDLEYFNSSSGKLILDICKVLAGLKTKGIKVIVNWHSEREDEDMLEAGKEISRIVNLPFEYLESERI